VRRIVPLVLATAVAVPLAAQVVFRSTTQYVAVDVVVTDKNDKPVEGLTKDDFEIVDGGKTQTIADFQAVSIPAVTRDIPVGAPSEPEPDVETNVAPSPDSRLFVIVIDDLHLIEQDLIRIKRTLTDLVNRFSPDDEVAMVFVSHSNLGINYTRNASVLMARIDGIKEALGFGLDALAAGPEGPDESVGGKSGFTAGSVAGSEPPPPPSRFRLAYAQNAIQTLSMVVKSMTGSNHTRRAVFFVTGGTTLDPFEAGTNDPAARGDALMLRDDYLKAFDDAKRAGVPIYVVDPRGSEMPEDAVRGGEIITSFQTRQRITQNIRTQHNNMTEIAVNTGGRAVFNATDMTRMMQEIVEENGSYYLLGYYPNPYTPDGRFHELKVHVRRPGLRVRARAGYEAPSATKATAPASEAVSSALAAGVNVSALPLRAFAEPIAAKDKTITVAVTVEVRYPLPADGSKRLDDTLEMKIIALDADAKTKASSTKAQHFTAVAPASEPAVFLMNGLIDVPDQPLTLRVAVGSQALAKAGSVQLAVELPRESKGLALGGIAVGFDGPPREAAMWPEAFAGLIPFQPTTTRTFSAGDVLRLFGHVYWKDASTTPSVAMTLTGPNGTTTSLPTLIRQKAVGDRQEDAVLAALLPLNGLAPGRYDLTVDARLAAGEPAARHVLFEIR
jgi:VWFA-related protein